MEVEALAHTRQAKEAQSGNYMSVGHRDGSRNASDHPNSGKPPVLFSWYDMLHTFAQNALEE
jgi:hypothetical protein